MTKEEWIANAREMLDFLEQHPILMPRTDQGICMALAKPHPEDADKVLELLPAIDCSNDPARFFGPGDASWEEGRHWMYLWHRDAPGFRDREMIEGLRVIAADTV